MKRYSIWLERTDGQVVEKEFDSRQIAQVAFDMYDNGNRVARMYLYDNAKGKEAEQIDGVDYTFK